MFLTYTVFDGHFLALIYRTPNGWNVHHISRLWYLDAHVYTGPEPLVSRYALEVTYDCRFRMSVIFTFHKRVYSVKIVFMECIYSKHPYICWSCEPIHEVLISRPTFLEERTHLFYDNTVPELYHKHTRGCTRSFSAVHIVHLKEFDVRPNRKVVSFV